MLCRLCISLSLSNYLLISIFIHVYNMVIRVFLSFFLSSLFPSSHPKILMWIFLSFFLSKRIKYNIQTQLAHIANGKMVKNRVLICNNSEILDTFLRHFMTSSFPSIMSPLQLTSKQWIITQPITARADLFLNQYTGFFNNVHSPGGLHYLWIKTLL